MKEIYILNQGDSIKKISFEKGIDVQGKLSKDKLFGYDFATLADGTDDIIVVRNYFPRFLYNVKKEDTIIDMMSRGFELENITEISEGDKIILYKPRSIRYVVKPLENLDTISIKFGVKKEDIIINNKLLSDKLFVGQILWI